MGKPVLNLADEHMLKEVLVKEFSVFTNRRVSTLTTLAVYK